ncbi:uncharacterized protein TNCV_257331 [Trichonephila clavipes]|nr:uncharacterized protein TNCV_257331 [Trichonephila clavipes]
MSANPCDVQVEKLECIGYIQKRISTRGNDEWSFEEEIVNFGCEVYTFDPSLKMGHHQHKPNIWFYAFGISHFNENKFLQKKMKTWRMRTLDAIMEFLGHENRTIDVLKMDIEGDEWNVFQDMLEKNLFKILRNLDISRPKTSLHEVFNAEGATSVLELDTFQSETNY